MYTNKILKTSNNYNFAKTRQQITTPKNSLEKTTEELLIGREFKDPNNQYHNYAHGEVEPFTENITHDFSLLPRIQLEYPIIDPEYTVIDTIKTLRDLYWYSGRLQGEWQNARKGTTEWPIMIHIDTTNTLPGWKEEIRKVIQYYRDSLDIHPDSLIKETPIRIEWGHFNGFSTMNINYKDSTEYYLQGTYWGMVNIISGITSKKIGAEIYIDTNKVQTQQIQTIISRALQIYITSGIFPINHQEYLGYTHGLRIGPRNRPNNDEKKWIKIGRNMAEIYINRIQP